MYNAQKDKAVGQGFALPSFMPSGSQEEDFSFESGWQGAHSSSEEEGKEEEEVTEGGGVVVVVVVVEGRKDAFFARVAIAFRK